MNKQTAIRLYKQAMKGALKRGIGFDLTEQQFFEIDERSGGLCEVSGIPFSSLPTPHHKRPFAPSLDRIDSSLPYTYANCRMVCVCVNVAMGEWGEGVLLRVAESIVRNRNIPVIESCAKALAKQLSESLLSERLNDRPAPARKVRQEAAERLISQPQLQKLMGGISAMTVWRWRQEGILPEPIQINKRNFFKNSDVVALQESRSANNAVSPH